MNSLDPPSSIPRDDGSEPEAPGHRVMAGALAFCVLGTALVIGPEGLEEGEPFGLPKLLVLLVSSVALALVLLRHPPRLPPSVARVGTCLVVALGLSLVCVLQSAFSQRLGLERLGLEASGILVFVAAASVGGDTVTRRRLHAVVLAAACLIAGLALVEALGLILPWGELRRPVSLLGNRNVVAGYVGFVLPLALQRCARGERPWLSGGVALLLVVTVTLCRTRSVWLGLAVAGAVQVLLLLVRHFRQGAPPPSGRTVVRVLAPLLLGVFAASALPWPGLQWREESPLASSASRLLEYERGSGRYRVAQHRVGLEILAATPWLGVGPHGWTQASGQFSHTVPGVHATPFGDGAAPRSDLLRVATETGLLGLVPRLLAVLLLFILLTRQTRVDPTSSALASACVLTVHALFDTPLLRSEQLALGAVLLGASVGASAPEAARPLPSGRWTLAVPGLLAALGLVLVGSYALHIFSTPYAITPALLASDRPKAMLTVAARLEDSAGCGATEALVTRALDAAPFSLGALCFAARCSAQEGRPARARELIQRALQIEPHLESLAAKAPGHDCARIPSLETLSRQAIP